MNIGIDIDGVLNEQYNFCIEYGSKYCTEIKKYYLKNIDKINTTEMFEWSDEVAHEFWNKYRKVLVVYLPAKRFSSEVIKKLKQEGNKIYIITARKNDDEWFPKELRSNVEQLTKDWLKNNNIYYDEIAFDVKDKGTYCLSHSIDIMIEDDPVNLDRLIGNTNIIVFDYPYNCDYKFKDLTRAFSWYDIYYKYSLMKNRLS